MRAVIGALMHILFAFCFASKEVFEKYPKNIGSDEKYITVAIVLAGFGAADANLKSDVGVWLEDSYEEAAKILSEELQVQLKFDITDIITAPRSLTNEIVYRTVDGQMHGPTILNDVKKTFTNHLNPDIICVITKDKFYDGRLSNQLGFSTFTTLCNDIVPILLTFDSEIEDDVEATARRLSKLVRSSMDDNRWNSADQRKGYFDGCNIKYKLKGDAYDDEYYVLPIDKAGFYDF
uniref:Putative ixodes 26 kDa salivary protein n=1 Tax=Ixodes ricinus TaxID=34613 RepID=A0A0K8R7H0_IXORI